jgi:hypothetical protein
MVHVDGPVALDGVAVAFDDGSGRRSMPSTKRPGRRWGTETPRSRRSPRPPSAAAGVSSAASARWTAKASCCRPGNCFPSSPTASTRSPSSRPSIASTPSSSWPSATSRIRGVGALPIGHVHGQRRLDGNRRGRAQRAALDQRHRAARPDHPAARTIRRRLLSLPGRLTPTARRWTLHLHARWAWQHDFIRASRASESSRRGLTTPTLSTARPRPAGTPARRDAPQSQPPGHKLPASQRALAPGTTSPATNRTPSPSRHRTRSMTPTRGSRLNQDVRPTGRVREKPHLGPRGRRARRNEVCAR